MQPATSFFELLQDAASTPYLSLAWRSVVLESVQSKPDLEIKGQLSDRQSYLQRHVIPLIKTDNFGLSALCDKLTSLTSPHDIASQLDLPDSEYLSSEIWLDWATVAIESPNPAACLYALCNYWTFPIEGDEVHNQDAIAHRMLRFSLCRARNVTGQTPLRFGTKSDFLKFFTPGTEVRREITTLLRTGTELVCLSDSWKSEILKRIALRPTEWLVEYRRDNLGILKRFINGYCEKPDNSEEQEFSRICRSLQSEHQCVLFVNELSPDGVFTTWPNSVAWLAAGERALFQDMAAAAVYCTAFYFSFPVLRSQDDLEVERGMQLLRQAIRRMRAKGRQQPSSTHESMTNVAPRTVTWINDYYAVHRAVCPECHQERGVELRAYFGGNATRSIERELGKMRIKCMDGCTVGTGDYSGLYLVKSGKCINWTRQEIHQYLLKIRSPLASKFVDGGEFDREVDDDDLIE